MDKPKLRPIQAFPVRQRGRVFVQIHDPSRISDKVLVVSQEAAFLLALLDGTHSVTDIQAAWMRQFGELLFTEQVQSILDQLDQALLLDSDHFRTHLRELEAEFRQSPLRAPCSAGSGYPADPAELTAQLDGFFTADGGPGMPGPAADRGLVGLIAPHIDFTRGGPAYAHAYKALAEDCAADIFVVFGTAHFADKALFILTRKSFVTPLGTMTTDAGLVEAIASRCGRSPFDEELLHKSEHSIEFQVVCLQHVLRGRPAAIVPVLCGSMERAVGDERAPREVPEVSDFLDALRDAVKASGRRVCAIAGADLSHVGRQFGDDFALDAQVMEDVEAADRGLLGHVTGLDPDALYGAVRADDNARHVCGVPPMYALLATTHAARCTLLDYRQAADADLDRAVTFASLALYR